MVTVISLKQELASNYSNVMAIPKEDVLNILKTLQVNAIEKLAARSLFQKKGLATVRVKIVGNIERKDSTNNELWFKIEAYMQWNYTER